MDANTVDKDNTILQKRKVTNMRTSNSIKNIIVSVILGLVVIVANFVMQRYFVQTLGVQLLGLNSLFTNIISMLSVAELGFGSAVIFHLYKPLHENDMSSVSSLMRFYKLSYRSIAAIIAVAAIILAPFIPGIAGNPSVSVNIYIIYGLFVINCILSYLMSYKRSLLYADQKNYIINIIHLSAIVIFNIVKVIALISTKSFYLFVTISIVMTLAENILINRIVNKKYTLTASPKPINKTIKKDIFKQIGGLFFHKIGAFVVMGTDNIIISVALGLQTLGLYSNYQLIQVAIQSLFSQISNAVRASIGNLLVDIGGKKSFTTFLRLQFANQVLSIISVSVFFVASRSLVRMWLGERFVLDTWVVVALSLSLYITLVRSVFGNFKEAAGIFYEDRLAPVVESLVNIVASLALVCIIGLPGVFLGTAISSMILHCYSYPKFVFKGLFHKSYKEYAIHILINTALAFCAIGSSFIISRMITMNNPLLQLIYDGVVAIIVPLFIVWLVYRNTDEYLYFKKLFTKIFRKLVKRHA